MPAWAARAARGGNRIVGPRPDAAPLATRRRPSARRGWLALRPMSVVSQACGERGTDHAAPPLDGRNIVPPPRSAHRTRQFDRRQPTSRPSARPRQVRCRWTPAHREPAASLVKPAARRRIRDVSLVWPPLDVLRDYKAAQADLLEDRGGQTGNAGLSCRILSGADEQVGVYELVGHATTRSDPDLPSEIG